MSLKFVVQKHDSPVRLHYDFNIEVNKNISSWAITKGPTLDPAQKRLAIKNPDHDNSGPTEIWDEGNYIPEVEISKGVREEIKDQKEGEKVMEEGLEKGEIKFFLEGKKLKGSFALVKTKNFGPKNSWLLIKHKDKFCKENFDANSS